MPIAGMSNAGRSGRRWRTLKDNLLVSSRSQQRPCILCGQPIDYSLTSDHPEAFSVEHIKAWSTHPELREDPSNLAPSHSRCNKSKGARQNVPELGATSREW